MRYADGPTVQGEVLVEAPAETVWRLVTDIELPARFSQELLGARWLDPVPAVGARFVGRNRHPAIGEWETTSYVAELAPRRAFRWHVSDLAHPSASWWFQLQEQDGGVRLRQGMRMGPGPSGLTPAIEAMPDKEERIIARRLAEHERSIAATLQGIKGLAEAER